MNKFHACLKSALFYGLLIGMPAVSAFAQSLDTVSGPVGQSLTQTNSMIAPESSTVVVPGANDLLSPDERTPIFDATKSNIFATGMNPLDASSYIVGKPATQLDGSIKDLTRLTNAPLLGAMPGNAANSLNSKKSAFGPSTSLSLSGAASSFSSSARNRMQFVNPVEDNAALHSSWWVGSSNAGASDSSIQIFDATKEAPDLTGASLEPEDGTGMATTRSLHVAGEDGLKRSVTQPGRILPVRAMPASTQVSSEKQNRASSTSPLERVESFDGDPDAVKKNDTPFKSLSAVDFLNPDILSRVAQPASSTSSLAMQHEMRPSRLNNVPLDYQRANVGSQAKTFDRRRVYSQMEGRETGSQSPGEQRLQTTQRTKWHNPILREMEELKSPDR